MCYIEISIGVEFESLPYLSKRQSFPSPHLIHSHAYFASDALAEIHPVAVEVDGPLGGGLGEILLGIVG